jgi:arginine/lysine/ornithine decarboxylase
MDASVSLASSAKNALRKIPGLLVLDKSTIDKKAAAEVALAGIDPLRITVGLWELGLTGFDADDILRLEYGVVAELPSLLSLTFVVSAGTSSQDIIRLIGSLEALSAQYRTDASAPLSALLSENASSDEPKISNPRVLFHGNGWENGTAFWQQVRVLSPREAFYADFETVGIDDAIGRVCTELLCPYPPGIPVIVPGEVITQEALDYVRAVLQGGGIVTGASDTSFASINVVV